MVQKDQPKYKIKFLAIAVLECMQIQILNCLRPYLFDIMLHGPNIFKYGQVGWFENENDDKIVKTDKKSGKLFY